MHLQLAKAPEAYADYFRVTGDFLLDPSSGRRRNKAPPPSDLRSLTSGSNQTVSDSRFHFFFYWGWFRAPVEANSFNTSSVTVFPMRPNSLDVKHKPLGFSPLRKTCPANLQGTFSAIGCVSDTYIFILSADRTRSQQINRKTTDLWVGGVRIM